MSLSGRNWLSRSVACHGISRCGVAAGGPSRQDSIRMICLQRSWPLSIRHMRERKSVADSELRDLNCTRLRCHLQPLPALVEATQQTRRTWRAAVALKAMTSKQLANLLVAAAPMLSSAPSCKLCAMINPLGSSHSSLQCIAATLSVLGK